jgi:hypothetical protein
MVETIFLALMATTLAVQSPSRLVSWQRET